MSERELKRTPAERAPRGINYLRTLARNALTKGDKEGFKAVAGLVQRLSADFATQAREAARGKPLSLEDAELIMGPDDFLGPAAVETILGVEFVPEKIPEIPFTVEDLEAAKREGQFLRLRVPVMMEKAHDLLDFKLREAGLGEILNTDGFSVAGQDPEFYRYTETPKPQWALEPKGLIPGTIGKDSLEVTQILADYLRNTIFAGRDVPSPWKEVLAQFEAQKENLGRLTGWTLVKYLANLPLNKLARRSPANAMIANGMYLLHTGIRLFPDCYEMTATLKPPDNYDYHVGVFTESGHHVRVIPKREFSVGVSFSRTC